MTTLTALYSTTLGLSQLKEGFKTADADSSGALSFAEFEAAAKTNPNITANASASATFAKLDADGNKQLTTNELSDGLTLTSQVYSALLQGQELMGGSAFLTLLGSTSSSSSSLFGSSNSDYSNLTSSMLGSGSSSTSLATLASGGNAATSLYAALFDSSGKTASLIEPILSKYLTNTTA